MKTIGKPSLLSATWDTVIKRVSVTLVLLVACVCYGQQSVPQPVPERPPAGVQNRPPASQAQTSQSGNEARTAEQKISPEQAQALFRSVDEILQFVSRDTGLPIKHEVKRKLASREEVQKYITDRMKDDEDRKRLERSEVVLKKFGLLPGEFNLQSFLVDLLKEQVAGFYNTKDKTVYLLDWVEPEAQKPVLAHELTHALQDQNFGLEKWLKASKSGKPGSAEALMEDERVAARQAVSEGQAMVTLVDYMLVGTGQSLKTNPQIADAVMAGMVQGGQTPLYTRAPMFLRELLVFPYQFGLKFERDVLVAKGTEGAFAGAFERPPVDTHQVMDPSAYLEARQVPLMAVPAFESAAGKNYQKYDLSVMGEFDDWLLLKQYADQKSADAVSPKWRGGYYYAAIKPGAQKLAKGTATVPDSAIALAFVSRWQDDDAASEFAGAYAVYLPKRYPGAKEVAGAPVESAPSTKIVPGIGAAVKVDVAQRLNGLHRWSIDDGDVSIEVRGDEVLVLEEFDTAAAARITDAVFAAH